MNDLMGTLCQVLNKRMCSGLKFGIYGKDSPIALIEHVVEKMATTQSLDAIILNGDFVKHGVALWNETAGDKEKTWEKIKKTMTEGLNTIRELTNHSIDILPSIGNNDVVVHNQVPCSPEESKSYYDDLFQIWFPEQNSPRGFDH